MTTHFKRKRNTPRPAETYRAHRRELEKAAKRGVARTDKIEARKAAKQW